MKNDGVYVASLEELRMQRQRNARETIALHHRVHARYDTLRAHFSLLGLVSGWLKEQMKGFQVWEFFKDKGLGAPAINTGNPGEYTIRELAEETLRQIPESKSKLIEKPLPSDDPKRRKPDITLARELLGWEPKIPLQEGLARTIAYFRAR